MSKVRSCRNCGGLTGTVPQHVQVLRAQLHETQENYSRLKESYNTLRCEFVTLQNCYQAICSDPNV